MNAITLRDYDDVYFSITPLTRYVIQRAYRLDMDMDAEGVALYLSMREDEFAHKCDVETLKQQFDHEGMRQEIANMAAKVTHTKVEDDYRDDVPEFAPDDGDTRIPDDYARRAAQLYDDERLVMAGIGDVSDLLDTTIDDVPETNMCIVCGAGTTNKIDGEYVCDECEAGGKHLVIDDVPTVDISAPARDIMEQLDMTADEPPAVEFCERCQKIFRTDEMNSDGLCERCISELADKTPRGADLLKDDEGVRTVTPSPKECPRCHQKMIVTVIDGEDSICLKCGYELGIPEGIQKLTEILTRTLDGIEEDLGMTGLGGILRDVSETPSPKESWLLDIGAIAMDEMDDDPPYIEPEADENAVVVTEKDRAEFYSRKPLADADDDGPTPPDREGEWYDHEDDEMIDAALAKSGKVVRGNHPHITISRPLSESEGFDNSIAIWLRLDYVLYSSTAVQTNNGPRLVAFMVAREFYRR